MKTNNIKKSNKNKNRKQIRRNKQDEFNSLMVMKLPKELLGSAAFPSTMKRKLLFHSNNLLQGAVPFIVSDFRLNGAFSPDGAGSCTGFSQLAAIYSFYKVITCKFRYNVAANENALPVFFGVVCRDIQPSTTITTYAIAKDSLELAPTTGIQLVGETSGQGIYRSRWYKINPASVLGNAIEYYAQVSYSNATSNNPTNLIWASFVLYSSLVGTNLTNGVFLDFYLELTTEFYSVKNLAS